MSARAVLANVEEVFREAAARWTLLAYFAISSLFILIFASAVNLDVVDGALAGAKIFGKTVPMHGDDRIGMVKLVAGFETVFSVVVYALGMFLAIFATAHLVPRLQEKGTIDLYLSRPLGRVPLLLSRYVAGLFLATTNLVYMLGSIWLIVVWKTHVANPRFLAAGGIMLFEIAALLAFAFLIGVVTSSTAVSLMATFALTGLTAILSLHDKLAAAVSSELSATLIQTLYWVFPKTWELGQAVVALVGGDEIPRQVSQSLSFAPFATTGAFTLVCLGLASWLFQKKDF